MHDLYGHWAREYDCFYPDRTKEVAFWARLAGPYGGRVLDLMCGTAEVSLGLARHGYHVFGVDLSAAMLHVAAERLAVPAGRVLIIDDNPENIRRARSCGFAAVLFENERECVGRVRTLVTAPAAGGR